MVLALLGKRNGNLLPARKRCPIPLLTTKTFLRRYLRSQPSGLSRGVDSVYDVGRFSSRGFLLSHTQVHHLLRLRAEVVECD
jgi:hypothetical protein